MNGLVQRRRIQFVAHPHQGRDGAIEHLGHQRRRRIARADIAMHERHAPGQTLHQAQLELLETRQAQGHAESRHGRLAYADIPRQRRDGLVHNVVGMAEYVVGDALLGLAQPLPGRLNLGQHRGWRGLRVRRRQAGGIAGGQVHRVIPVRHGSNPVIFPASLGFVVFIQYKPVFLL